VKAIKFLLILLIFSSSFVKVFGQRIIKGRVILEEMYEVPGAFIFSEDRVKLGETDGEGYFELNIPNGTKKLLFGWVGCEEASIILTDSCHFMEVILLPAWLDGPKSNRKQDKLRKEWHDKLPELHSLAFQKGLFLSENICYKREFIPIKPELDEIERWMKLTNKQVRKAYKKLEVGDTIRIPYSGTWRSDGTDRTKLIVFSCHVDNDNYDCIIEGIVTKKYKFKKGYQILYKVTNCDKCNYESPIFNGKEVKVGIEFHHYMKYFKVITD